MTEEPLTPADEIVLRGLYDCPACHQGCAVAYWPEGVDPFKVPPGGLPDGAVHIFHTDDCPLRPDA